MAEPISAAAMRAIETAAIGSGRVSGLDLMERAGRGVVEAIFDKWPDLADKPHRAAIVCGPGNNGGDGFVVARLLAGAGWEVRVFLLGDAARLPPDAKANHDRWRKIGAVAPFADDPTLFDADLLVDALFGTGLARPVEGVKAFAGATHATTARVVAVDLPSGVNADTGVYMAADGDPDTIRADLTVTFHRRKHGHVARDGPALCGQVVVKDIGLGPWDAGDP